jgi:hypothetical protein
MRRHAGRIVDGRRFVRGSGHRSEETWQVESIATAAATPSTASVAPVLSVFVRPIARSGTTANDSSAYARASRGE